MDNKYIEQLRTHVKTHSVQTTCDTSIHLVLLIQVPVLPCVMVQI